MFNIVGTYLNYLISLVKGSQAGNIVEQSLTSYSIPQAFLLTVISAPIGEELLFRKCIFRAVGCYGEKAFLFTSASLFMLMHGNVIQYPYAFAVGLVFGWVYLRTGSIWYSIFLHAIVNFVGGILPLLGEDIPAIMVGLSILYLVSSGYAIWIIWRKRYFRVRNKPELVEGALDAALINPGMMLFTVASFVMAGIYYIVLIRNKQKSPKRIKTFGVLFFMDSFTGFVCVLCTPARYLYSSEAARLFLQGAGKDIPKGQIQSLNAGKAAEQRSTAERE